MVIADIVILIVLAGFIAYGWKSGLISAAGRIIGIFVGLFIAGQYYMQAADYFTKISFGSETLANAIGFIVLFGIVSQLTGLVFYALDKVFNAIAIIPGLKAINRLAGAILGLIEGVLTVALFLYISFLFPFSDWLEKFIVESKVGQFFMDIVGVISPFIPDSVQAIREFIF